MFKGCPPAIQPYLQGDLDAAARALEREGQVELAHALRGRLAESHGATDQAAEHYKAAGLLQRAADLHASSEDYLRAARLLGETGDPDDVETATRLLERVGSDHPDFATASQMLATVYERQGHIDRAVEKLEEGLAQAEGEKAPELQSKLADLLARGGDEHRSLELLEQLRQSKPEYTNVTTRI